MSNSLSLEESALLAKMKSEIDQLKRKVEELDDDKEEEIAQGIESLIEQNPNISVVNVCEDSIEFELSDDRTIIIPARWSWRLENANETERQNYEVAENGNRVVWPDVGVEITVQGILTGDPEPRPEE
jgi:TolA-binding protein